MIDFERIDINEIYIGQLRIKSENLTAEDMPTPVMKDIFELCGRETAVKLLLYMQGNIIQVPTRPWIKIQTE